MLRWLAVAALVFAGCGDVPYHSEISSTPKHRAPVVPVEYPARHDMTVFDQTANRMWPPK